MYKVFINDRPLIFVSLDEIINSNSFSIVYSNPNAEQFDDLYAFLNVETNEERSGLVLCNDIKASFELFSKPFKIVEAAGGIVKSSKGNVLWIKRLGKWDLPKGKIEKGESQDIAALREVEEECGVTNLILEDFIGTTYHTYFHKGKHVLKPTYWYAMKIEGEPALIPQTEEAITACEWLSKAVIEAKAMIDTYASIADIYNQLLARDKSHNGM
jgi:8-oxo-dGTP pyrophosphatase MutT (NUDIX family)